RPGLEEADSMRTEIADEDAGDDGDAAHRRGAALAEVALRPLLADLLADALRGKSADEHRRQEDRHDEREGPAVDELSHLPRLSVEFCCVTGASASATRHRPSA